MAFLLHRACRDGDAKGVSQLVLYLLRFQLASAEDPNLPDKLGWTPLLYASVQGNLDIVLDLVYLQGLTMQLLHGALISRSIHKKQDISRLGTQLQDIVHSNPYLLPLSTAEDIARFNEELSFEKPIPLTVPIVVHVSVVTIPSLVTHLVIKCQIPPPSATLPLLKSICFGWALLTP